MDNNLVKGPYIETASKSDWKSLVTRIITFLVNILQFFIILGLLIVVVYLFVFPINIVSGNSMNPNFCNGDIYVTYKLVNYLDENPYKYGDVISFRVTENISYIKRVIGVPGDKISISQGKVYKNGLPIDEKYLPNDVITTLYSNSFLSEGQTIIVPSKKYFVLGDNRSVSIDSRNFGNIDIDYNSINGKVVLVIWPLERFRLFNPWEAYPINTCDPK